MNHDIERSLAVCHTDDRAFIILNSTCVAVKDQKSGKWIENHYALGERISVLPKAKTAYQLKAWKLVVFTLNYRIEIGPIIKVSSLTEGERDYVYHFSPFRHLIGSLIDTDLEYQNAAIKRSVQMKSASSDQRHNGVRTVV